MIHPTVVGFYNQAKQQTFCEKLTADGSSRQPQVSVAILSIQSKSKLFYRTKNVCIVSKPGDKYYSIFLGPQWNLSLKG